MNKKFYEKQFKTLLKAKSGKKFYIKKSEAFFKIKKYIDKATQSFELAQFIKNSNQNAKDYWAITICYYSMLYLAKALILTKGYETDDHHSTQISLTKLFSPEKIDNKDINYFNQTKIILEQEYINYFEDAKKESHTSRYDPTKTYKTRRVEEVFSNTQEFISKLLILLEKWI